MALLDDIKPKSKPKVIDLVKKAGVDVSDWENFVKGKEGAASNPRYCYEWSFVEAHKVVVLCLWHGQLKEVNGTILRNINLRDFANNPRLHSVERRRALSMDRAISIAWQDRLPLRVILSDGDVRRDYDNDRNASKVRRRSLDDVVWAVTIYDSKTGACTLTRGATCIQFADQFSVDAELGVLRKVATESSGFLRNPVVRNQVLRRANGRCEKCKRFGFEMADGRVFLETHHVLPLGEGGPDTVCNVVALCPNDHREAHFGKNRVAIRRELLSLLTAIAPSS